MIAQHAGESADALRSRVNQRLSSVERHGICSQVAVLSMGPVTSKALRRARGQLAFALGNRLLTGGSLQLMAPDEASAELRHELMLLTGALCEQLTHVEVVLRFGQPVSDASRVLGQVRDVEHDDRPSQPAVA